MAASARIVGTRPEAVQEPRAVPAAEGHGAEEDRERQRAERGGRAVAVDHRHPEPVVARALREGRGEDEEPDEERAALRPGPQRAAPRALLVAVRRLGGGRAEAADGQGDDHRDSRRDGEQVRRDGHAERHHGGPAQGAGDRAGAEPRVEAGHDRPAQVALDPRALDVHRDVPAAVAQPEEEQPGHDEGHRARGAERGDRQADGHDHGHDGDGARGAEPRDDEAGERQGHDGAQGDGQEDEAEAPRGELEPVADLRDPRGPARERDAAADEGGVDGEGGAAQVG
jgi:hypothetical protein